jgi:flagellar biosynthetic protein FliP
VEELITQEEALDIGAVPFKKWMLEQTEIKPLNMFLDFSNTTMPDNPEELPLTIIIPAFMTSELGRAFFMGFLLFIPFVLMDMIVASTLMSMGMVMLPPALISLPFKLLLFIVLDGWSLTFSTLVNSFL